MGHPYWNDWYFGWGWFLWFGVWFLLLSSFGHWATLTGRTSAIHRCRRKTRWTFLMSDMPEARSPVRNLPR
jgi:hypothetical protein